MKSKYLLGHGRKTFWLVVLYLAVCDVNCGWSQNINGSDSVTRKQAISFNAAGTTPFMGFTYERLISNKFNLEAGLGLYSVGTGIKFFPIPIADNKMVFHTSLGFNLFATPFDTFGSGDVSSISYLMIGLSYFGRDGFNFGIDVGPSVNYDFTFNETSFPFYGNLKLGYRF